MNKSIYLLPECSRDDLNSNENENIINFDIIQNEFLECDTEYSIKMTKK